MNLAEIHFPHPPALRFSFTARATEARHDSGKEFGFSRCFGIIFPSQSIWFMYLGG